MLWTTRNPYFNLLPNIKYIKSKIPLSKMCLTQPKIITLHTFIQAESTVSVVVGDWTCYADRKYGGRAEMLEQVIKWIT